MSQLCQSFTIVMASVAWYVGAVNLDLVLFGSCSLMIMDDDNHFGSKNFWHNSTNIFIIIKSSVLFSGSSTGRGRWRRSCARCSLSLRHTRVSGPAAVGRRACHAHSYYLYGWSVIGHWGAHRRPGRKLGQSLHRDAHFYRGRRQPGLC